MIRGPKLKNPDTKRLAGTFKPSVDAGTAPMVQVSADVPVAPEWLSEGGKAIWVQDHARAVLCGAREPDSHFFAVYCEMMSSFVTAVKLGSPPNAASVSELRKQMEMLGIAGAKTRLAKGGVADAPKSSPFTIRPK